MSHWKVCSESALISPIYSTLTPKKYFMGGFWAAYKYLRYLSAEPVTVSVLYQSRGGKRTRDKI